jgi:pilus assembly protein CpaF
VAKFKTLSPLMLRNFLAGPGDAYSGFLLPVLPEAALLNDLLALVARAYAVTLFVGPAELSEPSLPVLDASDLLLWVTNNDPRMSTHFQTFLSRLSKFHFPHAFVHPVLCRAPELSGPLPEIIPGKKPLAVIPEKIGTGFQFQERVRNLARLLESRTDLSKSRDARDPSKDESPEKLIEQIRQQVQPQLLKVLENQSHLEAGATQETVEACLAQDATLPASREARGEILARVLNDVLGLGPLEPLLKDPEISEIMINGPECIYVERKGRLHPAGVKFSSEKQLRTVIDRIVAPIGRRVDESMPLCDARLSDGSRVNIVLPPLALDGASITIRKFSAHALRFEELVGFRSLSPAMADFLRRAVMSRRNIVISGGTGSGKTTLLNALSSAIPDDERIVTIEDAAELKLQKPHVVRLESRPPNAEGTGAIPIRRLVINALRMRPDRIVVGECRGGEALDMLQAMNTGHDGSMTTVHANSPRDALGRIETLVLMAGMDLPVRVVREQIRSAVHLFVQQARLPDGARKVTSITEVTGMEGDMITTQEIFRLRAGQFESTGIVSRFAAS